MGGFRGRIAAATLDEQLADPPCRSVNAERRMMNWAAGYAFSSSSIIQPSSLSPLPRQLDLLFLGRLAELAQRPGLDLPDPLLGHAQFGADLLERQRFLRRAAGRSGG